MVDYWGFPNGRNDYVGKDNVLKGFMGVCAGVFVGPRFFRSVCKNSFRMHMRIENTMYKHFTFSPHAPSWITRFSYSVNHANLRHFAFNMAMIWVLGKELVNDPRVQTSHMAGVMATSAVAGSIAESVFVSHVSRPMVGASAVAMGLMGTLAVLDPHKTWLMIFPIPGVTVTSQQLLQVTFIGHIAAIIWKWRSIHPGTIALKGHLGGLVAGYLFAKFMYPGDIQPTWSDGDFVEVSVQQWQRTFSGAWLAVYWAYLTAQFHTTKFFLTPEEQGMLLTKKRFVQRTWRYES
jgi:membrane associated rhomboid family serine protease